MKVKFNKAIDSSKHPRVPKGRVRENILNLFSQQPYSLTDLSRIIKVSKPTISYHLSDLLKNGVIEMSGIKTGKGGFRSKLFVLKYNNNSKLIISSNDSHYLELLSGIFEESKLEWTTNNKNELVVNIQIFLYHAFRLLRNITKTRHHDILRGYGVRVGKEITGKNFNSKNLKENLTDFCNYLEKNDISNMKLMLSDEAYHPTYRFQCLGCFQARENGGPICSFTRGIIEGFLNNKYGNRYEIRERQNQGTIYESCVYPMRRTKKRARPEAINFG